MGSLRPSLSLFLALSLSAGCAERVVSDPPRDSAVITDAPADASADAPADTSALPPDIAFDSPSSLDVRPLDRPAPPDVFDAGAPELPPPDAPSDLSPDLPDEPCSAGQSSCGGRCVDLSSDRLNCGGCGRACCTGAFCAAGRCSHSCGGGITLCSGPDGCGRCVNTQTDPSNCGACGNACPAGRPCFNGTCGGCACTPGSICCGGACTNVSLDSRNCGACGEQCCAGNICVAGVCTVACMAGLTACPSSLSSCRGSVCADLRSDRENCGMCARRCPTGQICVDAACREP